MRISDWSPDVCSSDLSVLPPESGAKKSATWHGWRKKRIDVALRFIQRRVQNYSLDEALLARHSRHFSGVSACGTARFRDINPAYRQCTDNVCHKLSYSDLVYRDRKRTRLNSRP